MWPIVLVAGAAALLNLPMGYWRARTRKFSWQWFLAIHLPIPVLFALRQELGLSLVYVPLVVACAAAGQLAGSYLSGNGDIARRIGVLAKRRVADDR